MSAGTGVGAVAAIGAGFGAAVCALACGTDPSNAVVRAKRSESLWMVIRISDGTCLEASVDRGIAKVLDEGKSKVQRRVEWFMA
jgi:hypothetical protein